ncbi:fumarylacetoacetate hydrolase [Streptomyces scabiei]|uniref:fumarylacetoacetate hydrolase family protein n=1 Tax=Streptomyces scabiei TaxID=1930 RepID=UPI0004E719F4|nr:fumarylacetoacetate hydrolase family protein [Streptomyces scabiei]KFF98904.1 fumarylacetoacetate hydrolase [Streptomyces scabiei]
MKLGRISSPSPDGEQVRLVAVQPGQDRVIDLARAYALARQTESATADAARRLAAAHFPSSMAAAIAAGPAFLDAAHWAVDRAADDASLPLGEVTWVAAVDPPVIRDSLTFPLHMKQFSEKVGGGLPNPQLFKTPGYFKGSTGVIYGHEQEVPYPAYSEFVDYELEMGLIVGAPGRNLTPDEADARLFGVTIFNDFSARDVQGPEMGMGMGPQKCKDYAYGIGPWITTVDELPSLEGLAGTVTVNGEVWSRTSSDGMIYSPAELLAYVSINDNLQPGDLIGSGTLPNGSGLELDKRLRPGDVVELELSGVGVLRNRMSAETDKAPWWPEPRPYPFATADN